MKRFFLALIIGTLALGAAALDLDEKPAQPGEWGFHPAAGAQVAVTPPNFSWRPQSGIVRWHIQVGRDKSFGEIVHEISVRDRNVYTPAVTIAPGTYAWRYRGQNAKGETTGWSQAREFSVAEGAREMPLPPLRELLQRIPPNHPRLFIRPEQLPQLRQAAQGAQKEQYEQLVARCERWLKNPPPTAEPPKYPEGTVRGGEEWRKIWWGNRTYTVGTLDAAATLGFTWLLSGNQEYGQLARRILMECAKWDPKGATGYRYNDEAGMPYNYLFTRTYTFINPLLSEEERQICRDLMKIRGEEMYNHLYPRHYWQPYGSHQNRAWHKLGELGIAFLGEIEGAEKWVEFAMNVFFNCYPVWSDTDGGWHEGSAYWTSYQSRFTWWADVMRAAMGINAFEKPFFSQAGYYAMYLMPPGTVGGGFGDLTPGRTATANNPLMTIWATQAQNPYWQWYVEQTGGPRPADGYVGYVRGMHTGVESKPPTDLPGSRLFAGTGQAYLNTSIMNAAHNVQVIFKSSPFGTQSHGYEANNSFILNAYNKPLLIQTGRRDTYGSDHHRNWMWSTRSTNNITINGGQGQNSHTANCPGEIIAFETTPAMDVVVGEAGAGHPGLERFTRSIIFVKPEMVVVYDRLEATEPASYEYWLHAANKFEIGNQHQLKVSEGDVDCDINILAPAGLKFSQTDQYDPNPRERIKVREWHLTATTPEKAKTIEFVTVLRPHKKEVVLPLEATLTREGDAYLLKAALHEGQLSARLPIAAGQPLTAEKLAADGSVIQALEARQE